MNTKEERANEATGKMEANDGNNSNCSYGSTTGQCHYFR